MSEEIQYVLIRKFGPSIFKVKIPNNLIIHLNKYVDEIIFNKKKQQNLDHGKELVGDVTQEIKLEQEFMEKIGWLKFLAFCTSKWIEKETSKKITSFKLLNSWIVRQFENEYNPTHWHSGHISGAGFLKLPSTFGTHKQCKENKKYNGGNLQLIHGSKMFLCDSTFDIVPEVGDFYFFPNYLMHTVFPFKNSNEERRSISFNACIDENIYNVYGS